MKFQRTRELAPGRRRLPASMDQGPAVFSLPVLTKTLAICLRCVFRACESM